MNQTVGTADSTTALTASPNPAAPNQSVTLTATATGTSPTGTVTFMDGTTTLGTGTLSAGTASLSYTFTTAGTHTLTASYAGDANNNASTSPVTSQSVGTGASVYYIQPGQYLESDSIYSRPSCTPLSSPLSIQPGRVGKSTLSAELTSGVAHASCRVSIRILIK